MNFFPEENPTKNLNIQWGRVEIVKKFKVGSQFYFLKGNSQNFEIEYKVTVVDKTLVSNISKFREFYSKMKEL